MKHVSLSEAIKHLERSGEIRLPAAAQIAWEENIIHVSHELPALVPEIKSVTLANLLPFGLRLLAPRTMNGVIRHQHEKRSEHVTDKRVADEVYLIEWRFFYDVTSG